MKNVKENLGRVSNMKNENMTKVRSKAVGEIKMNLSQGGDNRADPEQKMEDTSHRVKKKQ